MAIIYSSYNLFVADTDNYWSVFDSSNNPNLDATFSNFKYLLQTGQFENEIFVQLQNLIIRKPDTVSRLLDNNFYIELIQMLATNKDSPLSGYMNDIPLKLELIQHTFMNRKSLDSDDRIEVENIISHINDLDLMLKEEWLNLTQEEQLWPIYAHLLNFNMACFTMQQRMLLDR